ncbi:MAG: hypothetical protein ACRD4Q_01215 [Candidatus Acidiferrales bacterium]
MLTSRRNFLCYAASIPPTLLGAGLQRSLRAAAARANHCLILNNSCALKESLDGYVAGLSASGVAFEVAPLAAAKPTPVIIVPGASLTDVNEARWLRAQVHAGARVLMESGGAFLPPTELQRQRLILRSQFELTLLDPVQLWETACYPRHIPYVDFTWPVRARVRDFSRAIPLDARDATAIAQIDGKPVAFKRRLGTGTLVLLATPLGPHILSGDREAHYWLQAFLSQSR